jgi:F-type H+-transporting ATPase subunit b
MKRFYDRLIPALFLALCLIAAPLTLFAEDAGHETVTAPATEQQVSGTATPAQAQETHAQATATQSKEGHHGEALITKAKLNDLFWRVVNFAALVFLLVYFGAKPVGNALSARRQQVREEVENLEARRQDAEKSYQELVAKLAGIEKDTKEIVDRAVVQAEKERTRIIEAAEKSAVDITRQAEMAVQKELLDAKRLLRDEMADKAATMAEQIIKKSLTPDDQLRIVDQYLNKVEAVQ